MANRYRVSSLREPTDRHYLEDWNRKVQELNECLYDRLDVATSFGNTVVWAWNRARVELKPLVMFPGARTCAMFLDLDNALASLKERYRLYLVDVNGQPSLSDGNCPDLATDDYGRWASEIIEGLGLAGTSVAGASLGGLICLKLCAHRPELVTNAILMNTAGISPFSLAPMNLYCNLLPILRPNRKSIETFLRKAVFFGTDHTLPDRWISLMVDYQLFALTRFRDCSQKPARGLPATELHRVTTPVYLIQGEEDMLFPCRRTIKIARRELRSLKRIFTLPCVGHGIETRKDAAGIIARIMSGEDVK